MTLRELINEPAFLSGCLIRILLIGLATPVIHLEWFLPFLSTLPSFGPLPWDSFLAHGGLNTAFPYGVPYLAAFGLPVWLGNLVAGSPGGSLALGLSIFAWDIVLLRLLTELAPRAHGRLLIAAYWLSPVTIYIGYWHGQLDMFPIALLIAALVALKRERLLISAALFAIACAAKPSVAAAAPFLLIYLVGRPRLRSHAAIPILTAAVVTAALFLPFCMISGFRAMVLDTPEAGKIFSLAAPFGPRIHVYILPLGYIALLYASWRIRRLDFEMLWAFIGAAFLALLLLTPASPGWIIWSLPFVALHAVRSRISSRLLYGVFALAFAAFHLLDSSGAVVAGLVVSPGAFGLGQNAKILSLVMTLMLGSGVTLGALMLRDGVFRTTFFHATRRPVVVGISGDSGAGKDTLVDSLTGLFCRNIAHVSGDNYHSWDRHKPMWRALTHLNPQANDLDGFANDVSMLADGRKIRARHYDHNTGRMTKPLSTAPEEIIVASGLHALWSSVLNERFDVRAYLDMDENLRRFLKVRRDVGSRGYERQQVTDAIERRFPDAERFVHPQMSAADVIIRLEPRHAMSLPDAASDAEISMRLIVQLRRGQSFKQIGRILTAYCGLQVVELPHDGECPVLLVEGDPTAADIATAARRLAPNLREILALEPEWQGGLRGVMQLVLIDQIDRAIIRRSLSS